MSGRPFARPARLLPIGSACLWIVLGACRADDNLPLAPAEPDTVVHSIIVLPSERTIGVLGITPLEVGAAALNKDGEVLYATNVSPGRFFWSSSSPDIATVDDRLVTSVGEGVATITATSQGLTGSMTVTVRDRARLAWSVPTGSGSIEADIAIGADGTIYVPTSDNSSNSSRLLALSPQGGVLWTLGLPLTGRSAPAIGDDGTLYLGSRSTGAGSYAGRLIAVSPGGAIRWVLEDIDGIRSSPALGPDGIIYVAGGRHLYAVNPQGRVEWTYETTDNVFFLSSPAVASDGTIYVGGEDGRLYAISPTGSLWWTFQTGDRIRSSPTIGTDGAIYFGSFDGRLYAVNPDGTKRWSSVELDRRGVGSSPSIGPDGTIYVGAVGVIAMEPGGSIRWRFPESQVLTTPIPGADGTVYALAGVGIVAIDAQGRLLWDYPTGGHIMGSPAIGVDGRIISTSFSGSSASYEGTVHAIAETAPVHGGLAGE